MSRSWQGGSTTAWRKTRRHILERDNYTCQLQIPDVCTIHAATVHHTIGRAVSGDDPRHLVAACAPCNGHVGDPRRLDPQPRPATQW